MRGFFVLKLKFARVSGLAYVFFKVKHVRCNVRARSRRSSGAAENTARTLLAGAAALVVGAVAWLRRRRRTIQSGSGEKMAARVRRLKAMLEQLDSVLDTEADDTTTADDDAASQADADATDDPATSRA